MVLVTDGKYEKCPWNEVPRISATAIRRQGNFPSAKMSSSADARLYNGGQYFARTPAWSQQYKIFGRNEFTLLLDNLMFRKFSNIVDKKKYLTENFISGKIIFNRKFIRQISSNFILEFYFKNVEIYLLLLLLILQR